MTYESYDPTAPDTAAPAQHVSDLTPGTYRAVAREWDWDTSLSGDVCLALVFELTDDSAPAGYRIDGRMYFRTDKPDAKGRTEFDRSLEALRAMGLQGDDLSVIVGPMGGGLDAGEASLVVDINAKGYPQVKFVNAPRGPRTRELKTFNPPDAQQRGAFFAQARARMQATTAAAKASGTTPTARAQAPQGQPVARGPQAPQQRPQRQAPQPPRESRYATEPVGDDSDIPF